MIAQTERIQPWIQAYAPKDPFTTLQLTVLFMVFGTLARGVFLAGNMYLVDRVGHRTILDLQNQIFKNVLNMEMSEIGVKGTGDLTNRIRGETMSIGGALTTLFGKTVREPMKMTACLAGAAWVNWRLLLLSMIVCPLALAIIICLARLTKRANKKAFEESARLMNRLYQALTYLRIVRSYNMQSHEADRFKFVARDVYKKAMRISMYNALSRSNNELLSVLVIGLSVVAGGYLVLNQQTHLFGIRMSLTPMDFGQVMLFFAFLIGAVDPLRKLSDVYNRLQGGVVAADRVFPLIDQQPQVREPSHPKTIPGRAREIEFRNVSFSYQPGIPVLNHVSFRLPANSSLAIVGHNGCGKSTLINMLPRFFDPDQGKVLVNGTDLRDLSLHAVRDDISYVTQTTMLFGDSIAANIAYGMPDATPSQIEAAARKAHAHSFISELEDGYESEVGEHGSRLSGGQRQRLSLARAILKDPKILILDEATSQIDTESEQLIHETLREFIRGRTTLIVTHRMSTLDLVDQILVMADGGVADCGSHEELINRCAIYQRLRNVAFKEAA
jgi:ATP-binding cassette subfamily B protein/subfamily B ATP-binding cassette protein MsbA